MKTRQLQAQQLHSIQPWLRDHYAALRAEAGPRWEHTRAVVVPVLADTSHKVRHDLVPAAGQLSSRVAGSALQRSAPLRTEVSDRAAATLAAARGGVSARQIERLQQQKDRGHRKLWFLGGAAALGAALGTAAVLWQRSRYRDWVEDDAVHSVLDTEGAKAANPGDAQEPEQPHAEQPNHSANHNGADGNGDDPADPDGGAETNASSAGRRSSH